MVTSNGSADEIFILFVSAQLYPNTGEFKPWQGQERAIFLLPTECPGQQSSLLLNRCHRNLIALTGGLDEN